MDSHFRRSPGQTTGERMLAYSLDSLDEMLSEILDNATGMSADAIVPILAKMMKTTSRLATLTEMKIVASRHSPERPH